MLAPTGIYTVNDTSNTPPGSIFKAQVPSRMIAGPKRAALERWSSSRAVRTRVVWFWNHTRCGVAELRKLIQGVCYLMSYTVLWVDKVKHLAPYLPACRPSCPLTAYLSAYARPWGHKYIRCRCPSKKIRPQSTVPWIKPDRERGNLQCRGCHANPKPNPNHRIPPPICHFQYFPHKHSCGDYRLTVPPLVK